MADDYGDDWRNGGFIPGTRVYHDTYCSHCAQKCFVYPRTLYSKPARVLIAMYRQDPFGWMYVPDIYRSLGFEGGDNVKPQLWKLIEPMPSERADGSWRDGWWRLRWRGRRFVEGRLWIRKHANTYNHRVIDYSGPWWSIWDALGTRFDYRELMGR